MASGYKVYRGVGGLANVDFDTAVATLAVGNTTPSLVGLGHVANTTYTYVVRPFLDDLETPDYSARVEFVTDGSTEWLGAQPDPVEFVTAQPLSGGQVKVSWTYRTGATAAVDFGVYNSTSAPIAIGSPDATVTYTRDGRYSHTFTLSDGVTYFFVVTARTAAPIESSVSNTAGPTVADSTAPATPAPILSSTF